MTTEDLDFAKKITTYLNRGTAELKSGTAYRLQLARGQALARLTDPKRAAQPQLALARAGAGTVGGGNRVRVSTRYWLGVLAGTEPARTAHPLAPGARAVAPQPDRGRDEP